jgi:hypothetical protein
VTLQFRARDLYAVVRLLIQQPTDSFEISGDDAGLLGIAWKDPVGEYTLYLPTTSDDGRLQGRCLAPMRLSNAEALNCFYSNTDCPKATLTHKYFALIYAYMGKDEQRTD